MRLTTSTKRVTKMAALTWRNRMMQSMAEPSVFSVLCAAEILGDLRPPGQRR